MTRVALITGIGGQDGTYLTELLLEKGYEVHGLVAPGSKRFETPRATVHVCDLAEGSNLPDLFHAVRPDEVYHLAAQSHVRLSFDLPLHTANVTGLGTLRMLEAVRSHRDRTGQPTRFYQASSSEMFGRAEVSPQSEETPFHPRSPYACAKVFAFWQTVNYREAYDLFCANGILFNHESPRRGEDFVTRKITLAAARIKLGLQEKLTLGNLQARRDWGFAGDYVRAMWAMLQADEPDDFVVATGQNHSVEDFLNAAFAAVDLDWHDHVETDPRFLRPSEVDDLRGDASKARRVLGWEPTVDFEGLARMMVEHDLEFVRRSK